MKVAGDVNAVPPAGIEGIGLKDFDVPLQYASPSTGAVGVGPLAVGNVKYQLQQAMLNALLSAESPVFLDFRDAFEKARTLV